MSKKKEKEIKKERQAFLYGDPERNIPGAVANGVPEAVAGSIYDEILDFANYAFNKAHAVSYAIVSYRTAYMKCHYPQEYMVVNVVHIGICNLRDMDEAVASVGQSDKGTKFCDARNLALKNISHCRLHIRAFSSCFFDKAASDNHLLMS